MKKLNYNKHRPLVCSLAIALELSSKERKRDILSIESVQISPCGFVCEREFTYKYSVKAVPGTMRKKR